MPITRRSFLKGSAATAAVSMVGTSALDTLSAPTATLSKGPGNKWEGRVVINYNKEATSGGVTVNETVVKKMVNDAILLLTGETTVGAAWKSVFPSSLTATSKVAIKINILNAGNPCPHPFSVAAICEGLQQMDFDGAKFSATNITVYDMNNSNSMSTAGYTDARFPGITLKKDTASDNGDGALNNRTYASTLKKSDFLINVFSPRGHSIGSSFTLGFKSHYGTYSNAMGLHNGAPENLRDINCTGPVFNKTVLSVCSGIFGMNEGNGPGGGKDDYSTYSKKMDPTSTNTNPTTIIMSTDPVSCDMQAIKMMRMNNGKSFALADLPPYLKASGGVSGALNPTYNIGIINESDMDVRKIVNGSIVSHAKELHSAIQSGALISATHLNKQRLCFIEYAVPVSYVNQTASITITNVKGQIVRRFSQKIQGVKNHFSWDLRTESNAEIKAGMYVLSFQSGSLNLSTKVQVS